MYTVHTAGYTVHTAGYTVHTAGYTVYFSSLFFAGVIAVIVCLALLGGVAFLVVKRRKTGTGAAAGGTEMGSAPPKVSRTDG